MDEARNVEQADSGEYVTVLTIDVETLAQRIIESEWLASDEATAYDAGFAVALESQR